MASLYERLGGEAAIMAVVDKLYQRLVEDPRTRSYFVDLDLDAMVRKQVAFLTWAFGGPEALRGRDLTTSHAALVRERGLGDLHFDAVAEHLAGSLHDAGVGPELVAEVLAQVGPLRSAVLGR